MQRIFDALLLISRLLNGLPFLSTGQLLLSLRRKKKSSALFSRFLSASIWSWLIYNHHCRLIEVYMFVGITTATKNTTRKKGGTGDKRDALELETSRKRVRRMMGASAVHMHEV